MCNKLLYCNILQYIYCEQKILQYIYWTLKVLQYIDIGIFYRISNGKMANPNHNFLLLFFGSLITFPSKNKKKIAIWISHFTITHTHYKKRSYSKVNKINQVFIKYTCKWSYLNFFSNMEYLLQQTLI